MTLFNLLARYAERLLCAEAALQAHHPLSAQD